MTILDKTQNLFNLLQLQANETNTIDKETAIKLVNACGKKIVEKCHYGNSYSDENIILFFAIYHNEFHIFEHTVKLYQQHANTNWLTTTIDQYEFNSGFKKITNNEYFYIFSAR